MESYSFPHEFLEQFDPEVVGCVVLDVRMPGVGGMELLARFKEQGATTPVIVVTGFADVFTATRSLKLGAVEFFEKPVDDGLLLECVQHWVEVDKAFREDLAACRAIQERLARLSRREREVLDGVLAGLSNKHIARQLGISPKAVEVYRGKLMAKMELGSAVELVKAVLCCPHYRSSPVCCLCSRCPLRPNVGFSANVGFRAAADPLPA